MNNIVDIIYNKNERYPQISINGEAISRYMELSDFIYDDIYIWAGKLFQGMDDELNENYIIQLTGHPFHNLVLRTMREQSQFCSAVRFTPIEYKISMADKLAYAAELNVKYHLGVKQPADCVFFCTNDTARCGALVPCTEEPENYYITTEDQLPTHEVQCCVVLSEQVRFEKRQSTAVLYLPDHLLPELVDYLNLYHLHLEFMAKVFSAAEDLNLPQEDRLQYEAYTQEEYRVSTTALPQVINDGERLEVSYTYFPRQFEDPGLRITSSNPTVLFVSDNTLLAKAAGSAMVTLSDKFGTVHGTYPITVEHHSYVSDISIVLPATTLQINQTLRFKCLLSPNDAEDMQDVRYTVSNTSVAAFSGQNEIYGLAAGRVKVTVSTSRVSKCFYLTVLPKAKDVLLPDSVVKIPVNADAYVNCSVVPANASPMPKVSWRSSDPRVVQVVEGNNTTCRIYTRTGGSATLICSLEGTDISKSMRVDVENAGGCYVATAVYGSYDCPQVWVLRRYRDQFLASHCLGRLFIKVYYALSPTVVKLFGKTKWFNRLWRGVLDNKIRKLKAHGYEDTPYND